MLGAELHRLIALVVFAGTYLGLGVGRLPPFRVDRTGMAIIGAALMVVMGVLPWDQAVAAVDAHTLVLLFRMMIVAAYLHLSGFFRLVTDLAVRRARTPGGLLAMIIVAGGGLSALFVNHASVRSYGCSYRPRWARSSCIGALEIWISPPNG